MRQLNLQITGSLSTRVDARRLARAVRAVLLAEEVKCPVGLTVAVVDDAEMEQLHVTYRGEPGTTDVLSFPFEPLSGGEEEEYEYLGDVVIAWPQAARQAGEEGHTPQDEVDLLVVHGVLHLLGYDDEVPEARARMWARQAHIMEQLGLGHVAPKGQ
ncbi:MAG: rRNA maturation RNase YbeY [Ardenticatenia bacterium]|nr:rRNA maturation RNase YbeY [Ardenticatenia bacterium]